MHKYLYEVSLSQGRSNPKHSVFFNNVTALNGQSVGYGGINGHCVISHHMDRETVELLCGQNLGTSVADLSVIEITKETLQDPNSLHGSFIGLIEDYFLPNGSYPNIE
uniref:hypothetical protein n=1 Tax=Alcaligenes sp. EGD-AK7 TaxID=1386079 RepID=UPI0010080817|nr:MULTISPECIES: hypothetical protein [unclassified Alcaligenes]